VRPRASDDAVEQREREEERDVLRQVDDEPQEGHCRAGSLDHMEGPA
jgi:hypothetical protein